MTDSIEAAAVRATGSTEQVAVRSIRAGNDIVLTTGQGSWIHAYRALLAEAQRIAVVPGARQGRRSPCTGAAASHSRRTFVRA